jgi:hypothetical protein
MAISFERTEIRIVYPIFLAVALLGCNGGSGTKKPKPIIEFSAADFTVGEAGGTATITVTRSGKASGAVSIDYATSDGTATTGDYTPASGTLSWPDGDATDKTFAVTILDDAALEGPETVSLALSNLVGTAVLGSQATAVLTIVDDEAPPPGILGFSAPNYWVGEGDGTVTITVTRTAGSTGAVSVDYLTAGYTAQAPGDYSSASGTLSWPDGDSTDRTFDVTIIDDGTTEPSEIFDVTLTNPQGGASIGASATVTILDNDAPSGDLDPTFGTGGVVESNPGVGRDIPTAIAIDASYLYIVGMGEGPAGNTHWRIEKRSITTGNVDAIFGAGGYATSDPTANDDEAIDIAITSTHMIVVGVEDTMAVDSKWRVEKRNLDDGSLDAAFGPGGFITVNPIVNTAGGFFERAEGVVIDGTSFFVVGNDESPGMFDYQWRVQKRSVIDGALDGTFGAGTGEVTSNPSAAFDLARAIVHDGTSIYVAGSDDAAGSGRWRIEKRDASTGLPDGVFGSSSGIVTSDPSLDPDGALGMAIDGTHIYVTGFDDTHGIGNSQWRTEKRTLAIGGVDMAFGTAGAATFNPSPDADESLASAVDATHLFLVGYASAPTLANSEWRIEKRDITDGILDASFGTGGAVTVNPSGDGDVAGDLALDATHLYIVGHDESAGSSDWQWRIEKRYK